MLSRSSLWAKYFDIYVSFLTSANAARPLLYFVEMLLRRDSVANLIAVICFFARRMSSFNL